MGLFLFAKRRCYCGVFLQIAALYSFKREELVGCTCIGQGTSVGLFTWSSVGGKDGTS